MKDAENRTYSFISFSNRLKPPFKYPNPDKPETKKLFTGSTVVVAGLCACPANQANHIGLPLQPATLNREPFLNSFAIFARISQLSA